MKKILAVIPVLLFAGCLNYIQDVQLFPDGSGRMVVHYWMKLPDSETFKVLEKVGIFDADSIRSEFSSKYSKVENVVIYTDTTDSTIHSKINLSFSNIDSLDNAKAFREADFSLKDGAAGQKVFTQFIPPIATGFGIDGSDYHATYKFTFYGEIITHNARQIDDRTLTWDYTLAEIGRGKTISVTFKPFKLKETPYWIYMISGFVLLVVIVFLFRKKRIN